VEEGDQVKVGQLVAELDPIRYVANVAQAPAQLAVHKQVLACLLAGSRPEEKEEKAQVKLPALKSTPF